MGYAFGASLVDRELAHTTRQRALRLRYLPRAATREQHLLRHDAKRWVAPSQQLLLLRLRPPSQHCTRMFWLSAWSKTPRV